MLEFDSGAPGQYFGTNPGWSELGEFAISDAANELPNLCYNADMAYLLLDKEFDQSLLGQFENLDFSHEESNEKFWAMLSSVKPFCYSSFGNGTFFASQSKDAVEVLHSNKLLKLVEEQEREVERKGRLGTWQSLGPECGPEKCIEFDCERLRIQLAVRCFLHQMHSR